MLVQMKMQTQLLQVQTQVPVQMQLVLPQVQTLTMMPMQLAMDNKNLPQVKAQIHRVHEVMRTITLEY